MSFFREALEAALGDRTSQISSEDFDRLRGVPVERRHQTMTELVAEAMGDLGWEKKKVKFNGVSLAGYVKGMEVEMMVELQLEKDSATGRLRLASEDQTAQFVGAARNAASASAAT